MYILSGLGLGVFWATWSIHGFWWALVYGVFAGPWIGYRAAIFFLQ